MDVEITQAEQVRFHGVVEAEVEQGLHLRAEMPGYERAGCVLIKQCAVHVRIEPPDFADCAPDVFRRRFGMPVLDDPAWDAGRKIVCRGAGCRL